MAFIFVCGTQDFSSRLKGYENLRVNCQNCHNNSVIAIKRRNFFTFCYIPIIPLSWNEELNCTICNARSKISTAQLHQLANEAPMHNMGGGGGGHMHHPAQGYYGK
ncbi:hypothetical protein Dda_0699 [Drechslerella dactyloides]|uniref:Zinc-ribbon 15 domain-containing protein n=1 Tax=Drechslerella dactyloides TaxID=74499 RepID=A0AAD6J821_DREDA|nr:hypothetical protein Dda_0699 [Drechslerella dactyloides]